MRSPTFINGVAQMVAVVALHARPSTARPTMVATLRDKGKSINRSWSSDRFIGLFSRNLEQ